MQDFGYLRVAAVSTVTRTADCASNADEICRAVDLAEEKGVAVAAFPRLCVSGCSCGDLFLQSVLLDEVLEALMKICRHSSGKRIVSAIGVPLRFRSGIYDCVAVIQDGLIRGVVPAGHPGCRESRWFSSTDGLEDSAEISFPDGQTAPFSRKSIFRTSTAGIAVIAGGSPLSAGPEAAWLCRSGADIVLYPASEAEIPGRHDILRDAVAIDSLKNHCCNVFCGCGWGESTQDEVFGSPTIICENGKCLADGERFGMESVLTVCDTDIESLFLARLRDRQDPVSGYGTIKLEDPAGFIPESLLREIDPFPFIPSGCREETDRQYDEITSIQINGLAARMKRINCTKAVIGISGGLDSTLALLVTALAFDRLGLDRKDISGITMPGYGTSDRTHGNASDLMEALGISSSEISITGACDRHFSDIGQDKSVHDVTFENAQARERTQILMDMANKTGAIVIGTGDLSELALGWCTYNGDHMSMYGVNASIPKTLVRKSVEWIADNHFKECSCSGRTVKEILTDIIDTPVSPELTPADENGQIAQKTESIIGPYELHDFFIYQIIKCGFSPEKTVFMAGKAFAGKYCREDVEKYLSIFLKKFFSQQFKRSCMPDGPQATAVSLSPRGAWTMASDAYGDLWMNRIKKQ